LPRGPAFAGRRLISGSFLLTQGLIPEDRSLTTTASASRVGAGGPSHDHAARRPDLRAAGDAGGGLAYGSYMGKVAQTRGDRLARLADLVPTVGALQLTTRYWNELLTSFYYFPAQLAALPLMCSGLRWSKRFLNKSLTAIIGMDGRLAEFV
jgi:hypothetical protein